MPVYCSACSHQNKREAIVFMLVLTGKLLLFLAVKLSKLRERVVQSVQNVR